MPPACSTARSTARFMAVPSGIIAPCIGQLVYSLIVPFGCSPAKTGAMPRARQNTRLQRRYGAILHPIIRRLLSLHAAFRATDLVMTLTSSPLGGRDTGERDAKCFTHTRGKLPAAVRLRYTNDSTIVNDLLGEVCEACTGNGNIMMVDAQMRHHKEGFAMAHQHANYIDGKWRASNSGRTFEDLNPANKAEVIGL